jgi:hypothetical protein
MHLRRTLIGVLTLLCALATCPPAGAAPGISTVGALERFPQEAIDAFGPEFTGDAHITQLVGGTLLPVLDAGQLWQVYPHGAGQQRTGILVRDAGSRKVTTSFVVDAALKRASLGLGGEWLHATDGGRHVYVVAGNQRLLEIDTTTFAVRDVGPTAIVGPVNIGFTVGGLGYDPATGDMLVLYGGPGAFNLANRLTVLQRIDLDTGERQARLVRSCNGPLPATDIGGEYASELLLENDAVYLTCHTTLGPSAEHNRARVVRLPRASLWDSTGSESFVEAGRWFNSAPVDPVGRRIAVVDVIGRVTVVDVASMSVVGTFETSTPQTFLQVGFGLDRANGRFYFQSALGFGHADLRSNPIPPVTVDSAAAASGEERIVADGSRVYVLPGIDSHFDPRADRYTIYNVAP